MSPYASCPEVVAIASRIQFLAVPRRSLRVFVLAGIPGKKMVVFVDDGSSDGSVELIEETQIESFAKTASTQRHRGLSFTRNRGLAWIAGAKPDFGGYVMFLDSDGCLSRNALQASFFNE